VGVTVSDDGPGIPREHVHRLTERFYRVSAASSRNKGGTGLGLAIVKHILNRHGGRLEITSEPGRGSAFTAWLPRSDATSGTAGTGGPRQATDGNIRSA
jgi:two-component system phosphate regulon sensor histidine kinase PhoR